MCALHDAKGPGGWDRAGGERAARGGACEQCTRETSELCLGLSGPWSWEAQYRPGTKRQGLILMSCNMVGLGCGITRL